MIPEPSLSSLSATLQPLAKDVFKFVSRLHAERHAGRIPITPPPSLMDDLLTGTLNRICREDANSGWWRNLLDYFGHQYITPDFLKEPALQEWLEEEEVRNDLKQLATGLIMDTGLDDVVIRERLAESYSNHTSEVQQLANGPIDVVTAILVAGYRKTIPDDQKALAGMVQTGTAQTEASIERLGQSLPSHVDPITRLSHTESVTKELGRILLLRTLNPDKSRSGIQELARRIEGWRSRPRRRQRQAQSAILDGKAVRWRCRDPGCRKGKQKAPYERMTPTRDLSIIDALIAESDGNPDGGHSYSS